MFKVGKLYICEEYFLLLYPDPDTALAGAIADLFSPVPAVAHAAFWTRKLGKSVSYTEKKVPLLVLNNREKYVEVLAGDRKGWIIFNDYLNIKEIDYA